MPIEFRPERWMGVLMSLVLAGMTMAQSPAAESDGHQRNTSQDRITRISEKSMESSEAAAARRHAGATDESADSRLVNLKFPGGALIQYVSMVRQSTGANVLIAPGLEAVDVPAMELKDVAESSAIAVLEGLDAKPMCPDCKVKVSREGADSGRERPIYRISSASVYRGPAQSRSAESSPVSTVENVSDIVASGVAAGDLLQAIETAVTMVESDKGRSPSGVPITIKFHEATGLIIARGEPESIANLQMVVASLRNSQQAARQRQQEMEMQIGASDQVLKAQLESISSERNKFEVQLDTLKTENDRLRSRLTATEDALTAAQRVAETAHRDHNELQAQIMELQDRLKEKQAKQP